MGAYGKSLLRLEAAIVIERRFGEPGGRELDLLVHKVRIDIVAFDADQMEIARAAYRRYGKGYHEAGLNFTVGWVAYQKRGPSW